MFSRVGPFTNMPGDVLPEYLPTHRVMKDTIQFGFHPVGGRNAQFSRDLSVNSLSERGKGKLEKKMKGKDKSEKPEEKVIYDRNKSSKSTPQKNVDPAVQPTDLAGNNLSAVVVLLMMMFMVLFAVHCTWVTCNA